MAKQTINTLKAWFQTADKPTQNQFWDWLDSFRHKDDNVLAADVDGLQELLDAKVDKKDVTEPEIWDSEEAYVYDAEQQQYVSYSNPASEDPQFKSEGFYRLLADTNAGESPETHPAKWVYQGQTMGEISIEDIVGLIEVLNEHANDIETNNKKEGITPQQANNIIENTSHRNTTNGNPHNVLKSDIELGNVNNTSDVNKPISRIQQHEFCKKINIVDIVDNLTTALSDKVLSANQGYVLKNLINNLSGSLLLQGSWDANTNTPDISGTTNTGYFWIVSTDGGTNLGGITDWKVNDWIVKTAYGWAKIDNTDKVLSVNSQIGNINLTQDDIGDGATYVRTHNDFTDTQASDIASSIHKNKSNEISTIVEKTTLADDDLFIIENSVDGSKRKVKAVNINEGGNDVSYGDENLIPFCNDPSTPGFVYNSSFNYNPSAKILSVNILNIRDSVINFSGTRVLRTKNSDIHIGEGAGSLSSAGGFNLCAVCNSGTSLTSGSGNIFLGFGTGNDITTGNDNIFIGNAAGKSNEVGNNNVYIGHGAGYYNKGTSNVFIGTSAGYNDTGSNKLIISNTASGRLIYGEFDNGKLIFNCAANLAQLKEQPTGSVDLAIATTKYVNDKVGVSFWKKLHNKLIYAEENPTLMLTANNEFSSGPYVEITSNLKYDTNGHSTDFGKIRFKKENEINYDTSGRTEFYSKNNQEIPKLAMFIDRQGNLEMNTGKAIKGIHASANGGVGITKGITFADGQSNAHTITIADGLITNWIITKP
ncbi:MAG: hypothetical protein IMY72_11690 [Bacteroidetes bacterium]|nr:hypothetical protein [Bacteroidota bacterium]